MFGSKDSHGASSRKHSADHQRERPIERDPARFPITKAIRDYFFHALFPIELFDIHYSLCTTK
jgi:hypothetical protein